MTRVEKVRKAVKGVIHAFEQARNDHALWTNEIAGLIASIEKDSRKLVEVLDRSVGGTDGQ